MPKGGSAAWLLRAVAAERAFSGAGERERIRSVLADLTKTGGDFRALATKALESASDSLLPRLKPVLDELGAVGHGGVQARVVCARVG